MVKRLNNAGTIEVTGLIERQKNREWIARNAKITALSVFCLAVFSASQLANTNMITCGFDRITGNSSVTRENQLPRRSAIASGPFALLSCLWWHFRRPIYPKMSLVSISRTGHQAGFAQ